MKGLRCGIEGEIEIAHLCVLGDLGELRKMGISGEMRKMDKVKQEGWWKALDVLSIPFHSTLLIGTPIDLIRIISRVWATSTNDN